MIFAVSCTVATIIAQTKFVDVELIKGIAPIPDACTKIGGYSPQQSIHWYIALLGKGRIIWYVGFVFVDVMFVIPSYTLWLGSLLVDYRGCPEIVCYLPSITACFDYIETFTHLYYAVISSPSRPPPSKLHLLIASGATQFKYLCLTLSLILVGIFAFKEQMTMKKKPTSANKSKTN